MKIEEYDYPDRDELFGLVSYDRDTGAMMALDDTVEVHETTVRIGDKTFYRNDLAWIIIDRGPQVYQHGIVSMNMNPRKGPYSADNLVPNYSRKKLEDRPPEAKNGGSRTIKGKGYCFDKAFNKWRVLISVNGKPKSFGYFKTEKEAQDRVKEVLDNNLCGRMVKKSRDLPKGIYPHKGGKYRVYLYKNGKQHHYGIFDSLKEAVDKKKEVLERDEQS